MALLKTPICDFGLNAIDFKLKSINGELLTSVSYTHLRAHETR